MENHGKYIRVCESEGQDSIEIPAELDGTLSAATLNAYFPGVTGLKFRPGISSPYRSLELHGDGKFRAPGREFACVLPKGQKRKIEDDTKPTKVRRIFIENRHDIDETTKKPVTDMATIDLTDDADNVSVTGITLPQPIRPSTPEFGGDAYIDILNKIKQEPANSNVLKGESIRVSNLNYMSSPSWDEQSQEIMTTSNPENVSGGTLNQDVLRNIMDSDCDTSEFYDKPETDMSIIDLTDDADNVSVTGITLPQPIRPSTPEFGGDAYIDILNKIKQEPANSNALKGESIRVSNSNYMSSPSWDEQSQELMTTSKSENVSSATLNQDLLRNIMDSDRDTSEFYDKPETDMPIIDLNDNEDDVSDTKIYLPQPIHPSTPEFGGDAYIDILTKLNKNQRTMKI